MRQKKTLFRIGTLFPVFVLTVFLAGMTACAGYADHFEIIGTDVSVPADDCIFLGLEGKYICEAAAAIELINEIRWEACVEGVLNPRTMQPLTTEDYVPIRWSGDLEYIARIRAAESALTLAHERANGRDHWDLISPDGIGSYGEVLAWNWSDGMLTGIQQWYEEKSDWVDQTPNAVTGHYTSMISPKNIFVGIAAFCSEDTAYYNCTAGEFSSQNGLIETPMPFTGGCIQILEVQTSHIAPNGALSGVLRGNKGDISELAFKTTVTISRGYRDILSQLLVLDPVAWSSDAAETASVDSDGRVTANFCGSAKISAVAGDISGTAEFIVDHKQEPVPAKAATCTETGLTEGMKCPVCGEILQTQTVVPAVGHSWNGWTVTKAPTYDAEGMEQRTCGKNASHIETRIIAKKEKPAETTAESGTASGKTSAAAAPSAAEQEKTILALRSDSDPKGSTYGVLQARMKKATKNSVTLQWKKIKGAKYTVYGNKCGKKNKYKKIKTVTKTSFTQKKLKKGTYYKYLVVAVKDGKAVATSRTIHAATTGGKVGNIKSVKAKKSKLSVKTGKTAKIKVTAAPASKKLPVKEHRAVAYESSNTNIATVSKEGVVKGIRSGTCYVYAYAQNGAMAKITVKVG